MSKLSKKELSAMRKIWKAVEKKGKTAKSFVYIIDKGRDPRGIFMSEEAAKKVIKKQKLTCNLTKYPTDVLLCISMDTMGCLDHSHWENGKEI